jgi:predicted transposase/invertase (TIGR01784 family)
MIMKKAASKPKKASPHTKLTRESLSSLPPLDPKNDAVFKALFVDPEMNQALISLVSAVIKPTLPIVSLEVLNPEISIKYFKQRGCTLDILVELSGGTYVDIEMQMYREGDLIQRALYYWSRVYSGGLQKSEEFNQVHSTVVIFFLSYTHFLTRPEVAHHRYFACYEGDLADRLDDFRLDFVELTKFPLASQTEFADKELMRWCQFFRDPNHPELQGEFMVDKNIKKAKERLKYLSAEPDIRELARMRDKAEFNWSTSMAAATKKGMEMGMEKGMEMGMEKGREEGELKQREMLRKILLNGFGAGKSLPELAKLVGCSEEVLLSVKKSITTSDS